MNKRMARLGFFFYIPATFLFLLFPKQVFGNIYILLAYLLGCLIFIYLIFFRKTKTAKRL